jgi:hypothetical protein
MFVFSAFFFFLGDQIVAIKNLTLPNIEQKPSSHLLNNASEEVSLMILYIYKKKKNLLGFIFMELLQSSKEKCQKNVYFFQQTHLFVLLFVL